jgi:hypothetical protein
MTVTTPSKNAISQAIKIVCPGITKKRLFHLIQVPVCRRASARYWEECYNILPWHRRSESEKEAAISEANRLIAANP